MKKLFLSVLALSVLLAAAPVQASPFDVCISGCKAPAPLKAGLLGDSAPEQAVLPTLFLSPSIGFDAFVRDNSSNEWKAGVIPGVGYGLKWRPASYHLTQNLLALDVFAQGALVSDRFNIDVLPVVTVFDWVGIGFGYRWKLATIAGEHDTGGTVFSVGIRKSLASF